MSNAACPYKEEREGRGNVCLAAERFSYGPPEAAYSACCAADLRCGIREEAKAIEEVCRCAKAYIHWHRLSIGGDAPYARLLCKQHPTKNPSRKGDCAACPDREELD